jgi:hypothetical protein
MNDRVSRVVEEISKFDDEELEAVLGMGERELRRRIVPNKLMASYEEYDRNRAYLESGNVGFETAKGSCGFLLLPPGNILTMSPTVRLSKSNVFVLAVFDGDFRHRRIIPLSGSFGPEQ